MLVCFLILERGWSWELESWGVITFVIARNEVQRNDQFYNEKTHPPKEVFRQVEKCNALKVSTNFEK